MGAYTFCWFFHVVAHFEVCKLEDRRSFKSFQVCFGFCYSLIKNRVFNTEHADHDQSQFIMCGGGVQWVEVTRPY